MVELESVTFSAECGLRYDPPIVKKHVYSILLLVKLLSEERNSIIERATAKKSVKSSPPRKNKNKNIRRRYIFST